MNEIPLWLKISTLFAFIQHVSQSEMKGNISRNDLLNIHMLPVILFPRNFYIAQYYRA